MREIKFRAWDKVKKQIFIPIEISWRNTGINCWYQYSQVSDDGEWKEDVVLMQYTGLKDKNGKEIYHKDRISGYGYDNWIVEWNSNGWKLKQEGVSNFCDFTGEEVIVIGNVYEN